MTMKPEFTFQVNLGTLLPIGLALLSLASWTGGLSNTVTSLEDTVKEFEPRVRAVESNQVGMNVRLSNISDVVIEVKDTLKEMNQLLREALRSNP